MSSPNPATPTAPDVPGDILAEAWRPGLPRPTEVHVHPELVERLPDAGGSIGEGDTGIPVVVDPDIPRTPGYEVHRSVAAA